MACSPSVQAVLERFWLVDFPGHVPPLSVARSAGPPSRPLGSLVNGRWPDYRGSSRPTQVLLDVRGTVAARCLRRDSDDLPVRPLARRLPRRCCRSPRRRSSIAADSGGCNLPGHGFRIPGPSGPNGTVQGRLSRADSPPELYTLRAQLSTTHRCSPTPTPDHRIGTSGRVEINILGK